MKRIKWKMKHRYLFLFFFFILFIFLFQKQFTDHSIFFYSFIRNFLLYQEMYIYIYIFLIYKWFNLLSSSSFLDRFFSPKYIYLYMYLFFLRKRREGNFFSHLHDSNDLLKILGNRCIVTPVNDCIDGSNVVINVCKIDGFDWIILSVIVTEFRNQSLATI